jgi:hypothetical protein
VLSISPRTPWPVQAIDEFYRPFELDDRSEADPAKGSDITAHIEGPLFTECWLIKINDACWRVPHLINDGKQTAP